MQTSRYLRGVLWVLFMIILPYILIYRLIMVILINDVIPTNAYHSNIFRL